jgi:hypothetical protein
MFGLAHEICGEDGLGWARRLQLIHAGAFGDRASQYLGRKYGYRDPAAGEAATARVVALLRLPALLEHRDRVYRQHLELPLSL